MQMHAKRMSFISFFPVKIKKKKLALVSQIKKREESGKSVILGNKNISKMLPKQSIHCNHAQENDKQ